MSFGFQRQPRVFIHDTSVLTAYLYEEDEETLVPLSDIVNVTFSVRRPEDLDKASYLLLNSALYIGATDPGVFGNAYSVEIIDPGTAGALSATLVGFDLVITLAHDGVNHTSTAQDIAELLQADDSIYPFVNGQVEGNSPLPLTSKGTTVIDPIVATNLANGQGPILYRVTGNIVADGTGRYVVPETITTQPGEYQGMARFTLTDGQIKSIPVDFDCIDPFEDIGVFPADSVVDVAWRKFEDCFDSEMGNVWLRDMTMGRWDKSKLRNFIPEALIEINNAMPQTDFSEDAYPYGANDGGDALFAQGILVAAIRHLMRSYTEQPDITNSPLGFLDRKRYQQAWKAIYDIEYAVFLRWLALYKRRLFNQSPTRVLISNKAGRLYGAAMRTRNAGRGGYW